MLYCRLSSAWLEATTHKPGHEDGHRPGSRHKGRSPWTNGIHSQLRPRRPRPWTGYYGHEGFEDPTASTCRRGRSGACHAAQNPRDALALARAMGHGGQNAGSNGTHPLSGISTLWCGLLFTIFRFRSYFYFRFYFRFLHPLLLFPFRLDCATM